MLVAAYSQPNRTRSRSASSSEGSPPAVVNERIALTRPDRARIGILATIAAISSRRRAMTSSTIRSVFHLVAGGQPRRAVGV
jgi:hypothetical protein